MPRTSPPAVLPSHTAPQAVAPSRQANVARLAIAAIAILLGIQLLLGIDTARRLSVTHDEYWHLPVGVLNLESREFQFDVLNPPLTRLWCALPVVLTGGTLSGPIPEVAGIPQIGPGDQFLKLYGVPIEWYESYFARARVMNVLLALATGVLIAVWSWSFFGKIAACATVLLWVTCPTILANAALVTPDMGLTLLFTASLYALWRYTRDATWPRALWLGLWLGLAQATKFTAVLLYPICAILCVACCWPAFRNRETRWTILGQTASAILLSLLILNASYLFRGSCSPIGDYDFRSHTLSHLEDLPAWLKRLPIPLPRDYVYGVDAQRAVMESEHPVFLDGAWSSVGYPLYYVRTLLYKLAHPLQFLGLFSAIWLITSPDERREWQRLLFLFLPPLLLLLAASGSGMQLGVRYVLPALPLLMMIAGQAGRWLEMGASRARTVPVAIALLLAPLSLRFHPHHLTYFNELAGGPVDGRWHLLDSNLDWGQALRALAEYLKQQKVDEIGLAYYGTLPPSAYGIHYHLPPSHLPQPGWYAVSVNYVMGRPHLVRKADGTMQPITTDEYGYFRHFTPVARIGYAIDVFNIKDEEVREWHEAQKE